MSAEIVPVKTTDRWAVELCPEGDGAVWRHVRSVGERLSAVFSPLGRLDLRRVRAIEDVGEQMEEAIKAARVEVLYRGAPCGADSLPELHAYSLVGEIVRVSALGRDPFYEAPADSPR